MKTAKDILDEAVREYNKTVQGWKAEKHKNDTYDERRGIFYNSLRRSFQCSGRAFRFSEKWAPGDIICSFREDGTLLKFHIAGKLSPWSSTPEDLATAEEVQSLNNLEYLDTKAHISFDDIKNFQFKF